MALAACRFFYLALVVWNKIETLTNKAHQAHTLLQGNAMAIKLHFLLAFALMLCATLVQAKTASEVFEKVSPSVVVIKTYDAMGEGLGLGSGVVLEDGVVVTNCHVVKDATMMQVARYGKKFSATESVAEPVQ